MAVITPLKMGNKQLLEKSELILDFNDASLQIVIQDMRDTMQAFAGVGIAAPQIGVNKRLIIFGFDTNPRYPNRAAIPFTILMNPVFTPIDQHKQEDWEGCLSVPGLRCLVERYQNIEYSGYDVKSKKEIKRVVSDFHARVMQHEVDHLDGILFPMRTNNIKSLSFESEL